MGAVMASPSGSADTGAAGAAAAAGIADAAGAETGPLHFYGKFLGGQLQFGQGASLEAGQQVVQFLIGHGMSFPRKTGPPEGTDPPADAR